MHIRTFFARGVEEVLASLGDYETDYSYTGELTNSSGLINLRARWYDTSTGRVVNKDTWAGDYQNPITLGKWLYANANPVMYTDPSGTQADEGTPTPQPVPTPPVPMPSTPMPINPKKQWGPYERFDLTLDYMYSEMINNANSQSVKIIRSYLNPECNDFSDNTNRFVLAYSIWGMYVRPYGPWDHKPKLTQLLDLKIDNDYYFPIRGDTNHEYYYDIWSNIHYGYVGKAAGFDEDSLQSGAAVPILAGTNDQGDVLSISIGVSLWDANKLNLSKESLHQILLAYKNEFVSTSKAIGWINGK